MQPQMPSMPQVPQMPQMPQMPQQAGDQGSKKAGAPMWVTVPVWMPPHQQAMAGMKPGQPMPSASYPMAMPLYMPQHPQPDGSSTPSSLSSASTAAPAPHELNKNLPFNMPVFPPMPYMHHPGFGPVTMVPPPQVDEQQEAPTHAPCA